MRALPYILLLALLLALPGPAAGVILVEDEDDEEIGEEGEVEEADPELTELEAERFAKILETLDVLEAKGDVPAMIALYRKGLAVSPSDLSVRDRYVAVGTRLAAYALSHKGEPAELLKLLDELEPYAGDEYETPSALWQLRAVALRRQDRANEADALVRKALDFKPDEADYHYSIGAFLLNSDLNEEAIAEFETGLAAATTADNDWLRGWCTRGIGAAHVQMEQYEKAADEYENAIALFRASQPPRQYAALLEDASWAFYHLGRHYELHGRHEDTIAANERALKLLPDELDVELGLIAVQNLIPIGEAYIELDKPKKALEYLERARDLAPDVPGIYIALGDAFKKLGEEAKATDAYTQCEELYRAQIARRPEWSSPYNNLAWFFVTHDMRLDEALELSKKSVELAPDTDAYLDTLAEIYHRMGEHDKAIEWIKKVFELDPKPRHLIYFEQQLAKFEKAKKEGD